MAKQFDRKVVLENGREFYGYGFGADREVIHEIVFNTSMVGYQEIVAAPSFANQMVCMTYQLIGNCGITDEGADVKETMLGGMIVREYNDQPSNFSYVKTLAETLEEENIPGIYGMDTRAMTRIIRREGTMKAMITDAAKPLEECLAEIHAYKIPKNAVETISCKRRWYSRTANPKYSVVAIDCGVKLSMIRRLNQKGVNVTIVPHDTTAEEIMELKPDGLFITNGPGNPEDVPGVVEVIKALRGKLPMFGVGLGMQLIALAYGAKTYKMKSGHCGGTHSIKMLKDGRMEVNSQNHFYAVCGKSVEETDLAVIAVDLIDNTVEAVECAAENVLGVQYYPDAAQGPDKTFDPFDDFADMMKKANVNDGEQVF